MYGNVCSKFHTVHYGEHEHSKKSRSNEHIRSVKNYDVAEI